MVMDRNNRSHAPKGTPGGGRFEPKGGDAPADDVTPPVSRPDPHDLAAIFDRPDLARQIDFTLADGGRVSGYAMDCERLPREHVPAGWHVYAIMESESDDDDADIMTIRENTRVNHRMDFATDRDLTDVIDDPELENVADWGFTDRTLADDLA